jgi:hypothetical protein
MLAWIENLWLSELIRSTPWAFPIAEAFHFVGLCLLMGSLAVIDLRLLGFAREMSVRVIHRLLPWTWIGFTINAVTGFLFFITDPTFYTTNRAFQIKMVLILLAGANALWFQLRVNRELETWPETADAPSAVKTMASVSLVLWIAIICFGRFIMYWPPI